MDRQANRFYEFGHFSIDEAERVLLRAGEPLPLTAKVFDILLLLIENRGHVVEKDRLMKEIWPNAFVEEGNLTQNISVLRKVLSEGEDSHQYIQTIPRRGYRFVGSVRELDYEQDDLIVEEHSRATIVIEQGEGGITPPASLSEAVTTNQHPARQETSRPALTHATSIAEARPTSMVESLARRISLDRRAVIVTALTLAGGITPP
jgi:DNA-binding winged helix-turn-helix (wHTH) protein